MMTSADWVHGQSVRDPGQLAHSGQEDRSDDCLAVVPAMRIRQLNVVTKVTVSATSRSLITA